MEEQKKKTMERYKECRQELPEKKLVKIVSRYDSGKVLFQSTKTTIKEAVEEGTNLKNANLENVNLEYANLEGVNLEGANLKEAKTKMCIINFKTEEYEQAKQFIEGLKL